MRIIDRGNLKNLIIRATFIVLVLSMLNLSTFGTSYVQDSYTQTTQTSFGGIEDFSVRYAGSSINACNCEQLKNPITITNTGIVTSTYIILGNAITEPTITLAPKESKTIIQFIAIPCKSKTINNEFSIKTTHGLIKKYIQKISSTKCDNIGTDTSNIYLQSCPCEQQKLELLITNTGTYTDIFHISSDKNILFSQQTTVLDPQKSQKIYAFINTPCDYGKEFSGQIKIISQKNKQETTIPVNIKQLQCNNFAADIKTEYNLCKNVTQKITFNFFSNKSASYKIITTPDFVTLNNTKITLSKGNIIPITLSTRPEKTGIYDLKLSIISNGLKKNYVSKLNVTDCFNPKIKISQNKLSQNKDRIEECKSKYYDVDIINYGIKSKFALLLDAPIGVRFLINQSNKSIELDNKENKTIGLKAKICETGNYLVQISVYDTQNNAKDSTFLNLTIINKTEAHKVVVLDKEIKIKKGYGDYKIKVKNLGLYNETFYISSDRTDINFTKQIHLEPSQTSYLIAHTNNSGTAKIFMFSSLANNTYVSDIEFVQKPSINIWFWLFLIIIILIILLIIIYLSKESLDRPAKKDDKTEDKKTKIKIETKKPRTKDAKKRIATKQQQKDRSHTKMFWYLLLILLILLILVGVLIYIMNTEPHALYNSTNCPTNNLSGNQTNNTRNNLENTSNIGQNTTNNQTQHIEKSNKSPMIKITPIDEVNIVPVIITEPTEQEIKNQKTRNQIMKIITKTDKEKLNSFLYQIWDKNNTKTLNMFDVFKDPDGDKLTFSADKVKNISISINKDKINLTPDTNWIGIRTIKFYAYDGEYNVSTPNVTLIVKEPGNINEFKKSQFKFNNFFENLASFFRSYWIYIVIGIFILFIIIMFLEKENEE